MSFLRAQSFLKLLRAQNDDHSDEAQDEGAPVQGSVSVPKLGPVLDDLEIVGAEVRLNGEGEEEESDVEIM